MQRNIKEEVMAFATGIFLFAVIGLGLLALWLIFRYDEWL